MSIQPIQTRTIDPFADYTSNSTNKLSRMITRGTNCIHASPTSIEVSLNDSTSIIVTNGQCFKDDVFISIDSTSDLILNINDNDSFFAIYTLNDGYYYVCLKYTYSKIKPAPTATIGILKPEDYNNTHLFLKCLHIISGEITEIFNYDPNNTTIKRTYSNLYVSFEDTLPIFDSTRDEGRLIFCSDDKEFYFGTDQSWVNFNTAHSVLDTNSLNVGDLIFIDDITGTASRAIAQASATLCKGCVISVGTTTTNPPGKIALAGRVLEAKIEPGIIISAGDKLFLSPNEAGTVTNISPIEFPQYVGSAISDGTASCEIWFTPNLKGGSGGSIGTGSNLGFIAREELTSIASQTTFDLNTFIFTPGSNEILVTSGGLIMQPGDDYTTPTGSRIVFLTGREEGEKVVVYKIGNISNYSYDSIIADGTSSYYTIDFTYVTGENQLLVFKNGTKLIISTDYVEYDESTIFFNDIPAAGQVLEFITFGSTTENAHRVDGFHASQTSAPNTIIASSKRGKLDTEWIPSNQMIYGKAAEVPQLADSLNLNKFKLTSDLDPNFLPSYAVFDGTDVWICDDTTGSTNVYRLNGRTQEEVGSPVDVGSKAKFLIYDATSESFGSIWVITDANEIKQINIETQAVVRTVTFSNISEIFDAGCYDGALLWVAVRTTSNLIDVYTINSGGTKTLVQGNINVPKFSSVKEMLFDGSYIHIVSSLVQQTGLTISQITSGVNCNTSAMILSDGTLWVCGDNSYGQLGFGDIRNRESFTRVGSDTDWVQVSIGNNHILALKDNGTVYACGLNNYYQLGLGDTTTRYTFTDVTSLVSIDPISKVVAGNELSFVLTTTGKIYGIGRNQYGQLGTNDISNKTTWTRESLNHTNWNDISSKNLHTIATKTVGGVYSCGDNTNTKLGRTVTGTDNRIFVILTSHNNNNPGFKAVAGYESTHVIDTDGTLWSCGLNSSGQLGDNSTTTRSTLVQESWIENDWVDIDAGNHVIALKSDGTLWSTGANDYGQLGLGQEGVFPQDITNKAIFRQIPKLVNCTKFCTNTSTSSFAVSNNQLYSWGRVIKGQLGHGRVESNYFTTLYYTWPIKVPTRSQWKNVAQSKLSTDGTNNTEFMLAVKEDGTLWAIGDNDYGQLGLGDTTSRLEWTQVGTDNDWISVKCGVRHSAAMKQNLTLYVCGYNGTGGLGLGDTTNRSSFTVTPNGSTYYLDFDCGYDYTMSIILSNKTTNTSGTIWGSGTNNYGQLGINNTNQVNSWTQGYITGPSQVSDYTIVKCGINHTVSLRTSGTLWATGLNSSGQLGIGNTTNKSVFTTMTTNNSNIMLFSCGNEYTMVINSSNQLFGTGYNAYGQLGINTTTNVSSLTRENLTANNFINVSAGNNNTLATSSYDWIFGCGQNSNYELGIESTRQVFYRCLKNTGYSILNESKSNGISFIKEISTNSILYTGQNFGYIYSSNTWQTLFGSSNIVKIDKNNKSIVNNKSISNSLISCVFDGRNIWASSDENIITKIQSESLSIEDKFKIYITPKKHAFLFDGLNLWLSGNVSNKTSYQLLNRITDPCVIHLDTEGSLLSFQPSNDIYKNWDNIVFDGYKIWKLSNQETVSGHIMTEGSNRDSSRYQAVSRKLNNQMNVKWSSIYGPAVPVFLGEAESIILDSDPISYNYMIYEFREVSNFTKAVVTIIHRPGLNITLYGIDQYSPVLSTPNINSIPVQHVLVLVKLNGKIICTSAILDLPISYD